MQLGCIKGYIRPLMNVVKGNVRLKKFHTSTNNFQKQRLTLPVYLNKNNLPFQCNSSILATTQSYAVYDVSLMQVRCYNRRMQQRKPLSKPPKFDYSGDLEYSLPAIDPSERQPPYREVTEWDSAPDEIKRLLSLQFSTGHDILKMRLEDLLEKIKEHPLDDQTLEYKIARYTILIRNQIRHITSGYHRDKRGKSLLVRRIQARKKFMRKLRQHDLEKFEWLCKELQIKYTMPPYYIWSKFESKRAKRIRVAREGCLDEKKRKLEEFQQKLAKEKELFLQEKEVELTKIAQDLKTLGIDDDMTNLNRLLIKLNVEGYLPPKPDRRSMRQKLLHKKFELYGTNKKKGAAHRQRVVVT